MNKLQEVMTSPKALASIKKLMDVLPPLAEKMAMLLDFVISHPLLAGGAALVGKGGASFASGAIGNMLFGGGGGMGGTGPGAGAGAPSAAGYSAKQLGMSPAKMTMTGGGKMIVTPGTGWPMVPPSETKMKMTGQQIGGGIASSVAALGVGVAVGTAIAGVLQDAADKTVNRENKDIKRYDSIRKQIAEGDYTGARKRLDGSAKDDMVKWEGLEGKLKMGGAFLGSMFTGGASPLDEAKANKARRQTTAAELATAMANESAKSADMMIELKKVFEKGIKVDVGGISGGGVEPRGPKSKPKPTPGAAPKAD
jgi:hypothetical protein